MVSYIPPLHPCPLSWLVAYGIFLPLGALLRPVPGLFFSCFPVRGIFLPLGALLRPVPGLFLAFRSVASFCLLALFCALCRVSSLLSGLWHLFASWCSSAPCAGSFLVSGLWHLFASWCSFAPCAGSFSSFSFFFVRRFQSVTRCPLAVGYVCRP